ncbi:RHS repeat-associated core domain-containing protein [Pseudobutyrivibrio sp.]|uniref:RHS repeat-associated core domain-containing protein n=1 Tax=Pseudobutyrivibrio sp. TaxID=2014367 RepID=UPI00386DA1CB
MTPSTHKTERVNHIPNMRFYPSVFTGKERDEETGYGYFGARYMDHELTTMWLSVDPMADKYPNISPYAYCNWNPVKLVDPDGKEVINRHTKNIENLKKEISDIENRIDNSTGGNLKRLKRQLANKQKILEKEIGYEKLVNEAIQDLKTYGGDEFEKLDKLTDPINGKNVDVYIEMKDYIDKIGGPEGKTYGKVSSKEPCRSKMGENTMLINLSHKYRDVAGKVLAHEGGHVLHDVKFPHVLDAFYSTHPTAAMDGHDQNNPSGTWANAYEKRYEESRRRATK